MATMFNCANRSSREVCEEIKKYYEEAYQCIDKALKLDESGKTDEAIGMYEFSLSLLDQALSQPIESPTQPDIEWEKAFSMIQKMKKSRKEIVIRISNAQTKQHPDAAIPPPSYDEAMAAGPSTATSSMPVSQPYIPPSITQNTATYPTKLPAPVPQPYTPASASIDVNLHNNPTPGYANLSSQLNEMRVEGNHEIIYSHNNVRLYFIAPDGRVSATSEPDTLIIGRIEDMTHDDILDDTLLSIVDQLSAEGNGDKKHRRHHGKHHGSHGHHRKHHGHRHRSEVTRPVPQGSGQVYLQVGSWVYPLIPGISPVFRTDYGAFILPDVHSELEGAAVGLILPSNADASVYDLLNSILLGVVGQQDLPSKKPVAPLRSKRSDRHDRNTEGRNAFATNIVRGATYLANNLVRGAGSASRLLDAATPRIITRINPAQEPQPINPTLKTTVGVAKTVSGTAATVTDYLAGKVGSAASALGQYLVPHIQQQGSRLLTSTTSMTPLEASNRVETFLGATAGAVQGIATVYNGLESAAAILGRSLSNNTVQIIEHKYGKPASEITGDAMSTAGNVYSIHGNYKMMKPLKIVNTVAKSTVKGAGSSFIEEANRNSAHAEFEGTGPGAGGGFGSVLTSTATMPRASGDVWTNSTSDFNRPSIYPTVPNSSVDQYAHPPGFSGHISRNISTELDHNQSATTNVSQSLEKQ